MARPWAAFTVTGAASCQCAWLALLAATVLASLSLFVFGTMPGPGFHWRPEARSGRRPDGAAVLESRPPAHFAANPRVMPVRCRRFRGRGRLCAWARAGFNVADSERAPPFAPAASAAPGALMWAAWPPVSRRLGGAAQAAHRRLKKSPPGGRG